MTDFFLLNPRYARYELGVYPLEYQTVYGDERPRFGATALKAFFVVLFIVPLLLFSGIRPPNNRLNPGFINLAILIFIGATTLLVIGVEIANFSRIPQANKRYKRLTQNGVLLEGRLTAIHVAEDKVSVREQLPPFELKEYHGKYFIVVGYQFTTPEGRIISGEQTRTREDLRDKPLPPVDTPIRVLYADDETHVML